MKGPGTATQAGVRPRPKGGVVVPTPYTTGSFTRSRITASGHTVEVHAEAELIDGLDHRFAWSISLYAMDDLDMEKPLFSDNDLEHLFAIPANVETGPTYDHRVNVPLPAGTYRAGLAVLMFPHQTHTDPKRKLSDRPNLQGSRGVGTSKTITLTD